jgi:glycosyltransferase involved in cell wall biosynthesis
MFVTHSSLVAAEMFSQEASEAMRVYGGGILGIPIGAQDWVDPEVFKPLPHINKDFDLVMIASFQRLKRHRLLFETLRRLRPRRFKLALIGVAWERTREEFEHEIASFGLQEDCTIFQHLLPHQVNEVLNRSKVKVLLSKMEGGNRAVMEAICAGVPVIVYKHLVGRRDVHPETGQYADDDELACVIPYMVDHYKEFRAREWFLRHSGAQNASNALNRVLSSAVRERNEPWTVETVPKLNFKGAFGYVRDSDRDSLEPANAGLARFLAALP